MTDYGNDFLPVRGQARQVDSGNFLPSGRYRLEFVSGCGNVAAGSSVPWGMLRNRIYDPRLGKNNYIAQLSGGQHASKAACQGSHVGATVDFDLVTDSPLSMFAYDTVYTDNFDGPNEINVSRIC